MKKREEISNILILAMLTLLIIALTIRLLDFIFEESDKDQAELIEMQNYHGAVYDEYLGILIKR